MAKLGDDAEPACEQQLQPDFVDRDAVAQVVDQPARLGCGRHVQRRDETIARSQISNHLEPSQCGTPAAEASGRCSSLYRCGASRMKPLAPETSSDPGGAWPVLPAPLFNAPRCTHGW